MTILRAILLLIHFTIVPLALGRLITYKASKAQHKSPIVIYVVGLFGSYALFYIFCAALIWFQNWNTFSEPVPGCFTALVYLYSAVVFILFLIWLRVDFKRLKNIKGYLKAKAIEINDSAGAERKYCIMYGLVFAILLLVQMYFAYGYEINEWSYDDYDYVVTSEDTLESGMISNVNFITGEYPFTSDKRATISWPTYIAYLAKASNFEVTTICHTILPVLFLLIAYGVYYYMAEMMFKKLDNRLIFMILLSMAFIFGLHSHYSMTFRLLCAVWQGKAVLSAIYVPFMAIYLINLYKDEVKTANMLPVIALSLGASSLTTMSMLLIGTTAVLVWIMMSIYQRKPYGFRYLFASMIGPVFQIVFYQLTVMLLADMQNIENTYFKRGRDINWWYKWFG